MSKNLEMKLFDEAYEDTPETLAYEYVLDFGDAIDEMADIHGMTHARIAEAAGMKASTLSQILSGRSNPTVKTMERVAMALDCKLEKPRLVSFAEVEANQYLEDALPIRNIECSKEDRFCDVSHELRLYRMFGEVTHA